MAYSAQSSTRIIVGDSILKNIRNINDSSIYSLSGITIDELTNKIGQIVSNHVNCKTILIHCGTNNLGRHSTPQIISKFQELISTIQTKNPLIRILISSILPRISQDPDMNAVTDHINHLLKELCAKNGCHFEASYKVFYKKNKTDPNLFTDGLHPSMTGTKRFRQFYCQRLSEMGNKATSPFSKHLYLRRSEWQHVDIHM
jgi:lysophospholipase L1-like esterase